jgi:hypothetical protein
MADEIAKLDSLKARAVADYLAGARGADAEFLVAEPVFGEPLRIRVEQDPHYRPCSTETEVVVPVSTMPIAPQRPRVTAVSIQSEPDPPVDLMKYDAVFWSESAVEKFLVPYLASKNQWQAAYVLAVLAEKWYGHVPGPDNDAGEAPLDDEVEVPYAVAHLPRSDYVTIGEEVHFLFRKADGQVTQRPLSEFL